LQGSTMVRNLELDRRRYLKQRIGAFIDGAAEVN
jgi:hypothetical protein